MAKKKAPRDDRIAWVTADRVRRLIRLLRQLGSGPATRQGLTRRLKLGIRGFYRDLELLRHVGIVVELSKGQYLLQDTLEAALDKLPFPDPGLSVGDARLLAKGRTTANRKIREQLERIEK